MNYTVELEDFDSVRCVWERLLRDCESNTIFLTPMWQQTWWKHFGDEVELLLMSVLQGKEAIGVAPMMRSGEEISLLGRPDLFDYYDFIVTRGKEVEFYNSLSEHLKSLEWNTLKIPAVKEGSASLRLLPDIMTQQGFTIDIAEHGVSPVACLPSNWEEYLLGLSKKARHELRRKMRRLETETQVAQYAHDDINDLGVAMEEFFRLHRASSQEKDAFWTPKRREFFLDISKELTLLGQFKLYFLEVDKIPVASCICFDYADSYLLYNSGYDPEFSRLSVGLLNKALCIKQAICDGRTKFDFLKGTERYKYDLGGKDQSVYSLTISR